MRVRNRKGGDRITRGQSSVCGPQSLRSKGKWRDLFGNDHPIHVEVGRGKGLRIRNGQQNPDINYIGIDIQKSVLSYALDKVLEVECQISNCCG